MHYSNKVYLYVSAQYANRNDVIVRYPFRDEAVPGLLQYTYGNMGNIQKLTGFLYANYRPVNALSFSLSASVTHNILRSDVLDVHTDGIGYNLYASCDATLPKSWSLGGMWSLSRQDPTFRTETNRLQMYSFHVYKRFLNNNLSIGLIAEQPFDRYFKSWTTLTGDSFVQKSYNYMRARSFGLRVSYTFGTGKRADIKRNTKMATEDMRKKTGVQ